MNQNFNENDNGEDEKQQVIINKNATQESIIDKIKKTFNKGNLTIEGLKRRKTMLISGVAITVAVIAIAYPMIKQEMALKKTEQNMKLDHSVVTDQQENNDWRANYDNKITDLENQVKQLQEGKTQQQVPDSTNQQNMMQNGNGGVMPDDQPSNSVFPEQGQGIKKNTQPKTDIQSLVLPTVPQNTASLPQPPQKIVVPPAYQNQGRMPVGSSALLNQANQTNSRTAQSFLANGNPPPTGGQSSDVQGQIYQYAGSATTSGASAKNKKKIMLPAGSFIKGVLLSGVEAPTAGVGEKAPVPVIINLNNESLLPNSYRTDLIDCRLIGSAKGDASTVKADIRLVNIACVDRKKRVMSKEIRGWVFGPDGKYGIRGTQVSQQGSVLALNIMASLVSGFGDAYKEASSNVITTSDGTVSSVAPGAAFRQGGYSALGKAGDTLAQFYLDMAKTLIPVIEVQAGVPVTIVLESDLELNFDDFSTVKAKPLRNIKLVE